MYQHLPKVRWASSSTLTLSKSTGLWTFIQKNCAAEFVGFSDFPFWTEHWHTSVFTTVPACALSIHYQSDHNRFYFLSSNERHGNCGSIVHLLMESSVFSCCRWEAYRGVGPCVFTSVSGTKCPAVLAVMYNDTPDVSLCFMETAWQ